MADRIERDTSNIETMDIGKEVDNMMTLANNTRKPYARNWYNNNFFDDGHHLRSISRTTGRIMDLSNRATLYSPRRSIPKASRQIRGMVNLILSQDFIPQIRPDKINRYSYNDLQEYQQTLQSAKVTAKKVGYWLEEEWKNQDLDIKLSEMLLLTMKNYISYMQVWPDALEEAIRTQVYDAFDIYVMNNVTSIYDSPFIIKSVPKLIREIKANENFDQKQLDKITPDSRYASDEIKEAYLISKFGKAGVGSDSAATLLLKEAFLKEYINEENLPRIRDQKNAGQILANKKKGDPIVRQVFVAGDIWLRDEYTNLPDYPFVDLRLEPGALYGVAQIERFIPSNKSLDSVMSRIERMIHTMNVGVWTKRKGENFQISNVAGGLMAEYDTTPPQQVPMAGLPASTFQFINLLNSFIEEQGVTTSALGQLPKGVKAWGAIESLKASEFSNLFVAIKQLKKCIQRISEKMLDIADNHFINKQTVMRLDKGEPAYFDIIGQAGVEARQGIDEADKLEGVVPIKKDYKVDITIESGLGYTEEGKKGRMMEIANFMIELAKLGVLPPETIKLVIMQLIEVFKFGPSSEMMESLDGLTNEELGDKQRQDIKLAVVEAMKDLKQAGLFDPDEEKHLAITKAGSIEALADAKKAGLFDKPKEPEKVDEAEEIERIDKVESGKDGQKKTIQIKTKYKKGA